MNEKELSPCPFCRAAAAQRWSHKNERDGDYQYVMHTGCRNPECNIRPFSCISGPHGYSRPGELADNETAQRMADEIWQTRKGRMVMDDKRWNENQSDPLSDIKAAKEVIKNHIGYLDPGPVLKAHLENLYELAKKILHSFQVPPNFL